MTAWTYRPQRPEEGWLQAALEPWFDDGSLLDVIFKVAGGKEAEVYAVRAGDELGGGLLAAKIYRPRKYRELSNDAVYREGRGLLDRHGNAVLARDRRMYRAVRQGTRHGKRAAHTSWIQHEFASLQRLHLDGATVPEPIDVGENAILMGFVGSEEGGAPSLDRVSLEPHDAARVVEEVLADVQRLLARGWTHGDLSAYNLLWWEGRAVVIDLPQVVDVLRNPRGPELFLRDVERVCAIDRRATAGHPRDVADSLWDAVFGTEDGVPDGCVAR